MLFPKNFFRIKMSDEIVAIEKCMMKLLNSVSQNYDYLIQRKLYHLADQKAPESFKKCKTCMKTLKKLQRNRKETARKPQRNRKETAKKPQRYCKETVETMHDSRSHRIIPLFIRL